jgi:hypothetical protein
MAEPKHLRVVQIDESVVIREQRAADDVVRDCKRHERGENANRWTGVFGYLMQRRAWFHHRMIEIFQARPRPLAG